MKMAPFECVILLLLGACVLEKALCLDCYSCNDVSDKTNCNQTTTCGQHEYCLLEKDARSSNMRCANSTECGLSNHVATIIGREVANRQLTTCKECCSVDMCNMDLCEHKLPSSCTDDETVDCAKMNSLFNICQDIQKAKLVCPQFCSLCSVVDGQWSEWSNWTSCKLTCGNGTEFRTRFCNNPAPAHGGIDCIGRSIEGRSCVLDPCPVHGGWSMWTEWGTCSVTCGIGMQRRDRSCNNPLPSRFGDHCFGDFTEDRICVLRGCVDGRWSSWSSWGLCSATCLGGLSKRTRICNNPAPSAFGHDCVGNDEDVQLCNSVECPVVHGGWTLWSSWSTCLSNCLRHRTRTCTNPSPSSLGHMCLGSTEDKENCNLANCAIDLRIRLVQGNSSRNGRVEVSSDGTNWGTVCDDLFGSNAAQVVCRMLGYNVYGATIVPVTPGTGSIYLDDLQCNGEETSLIYCNHRRWSEHNCAHNEDVGVSCS